MSSLTDSGLDFDIILPDLVLQSFNLSAIGSRRSVKLFLRELPQQELSFKTGICSWNQI